MVSPPFSFTSKVLLPDSRCLTEETIGPFRIS